MAGVCWGEQNPTDGEVAISWQAWSDSMGGKPIILGDLDWGKVELEGAEIANSNVIDLGSVRAWVVRFTADKYGAGSGSGSIRIRGSTFLFEQDAALPAWGEYTEPEEHNWRYIQVQLRGPSA